MTEWFADTVWTTAPWPVVLVTRKTNCCQDRLQSLLLLLVMMLTVILFVLLFPLITTISNLYCYTAATDEATVQLLFTTKGSSRLAGAGECLNRPEVIHVQSTAVRWDPLRPRDLRTKPHLAFTAQWAQHSASTADMLTLNTSQLPSVSMAVVSNEVSYGELWSICVLGKVKRTESWRWRS